MVDKEMVETATHSIVQLTGLGLDGIVFYVIVIVSAMFLVLLALFFWGQRSLSDRNTANEKRIIALEEAKANCYEKLGASTQQQIAYLKQIEALKVREIELLEKIAELEKRENKLLKQIDELRSTNG